MERPSRCANGSNPSGLGQQVNRNFHELESHNTVTVCCPVKHEIIVEGDHCNSLAEAASQH